jgi:hypothetical protein
MKNKTLAKICGVIGIVWGTVAILAPVLIVILRRPRQPQHYEAVIVLGIINLFVIALGIKAFHYYRGDARVKRWVPKLFLASGGLIVLFYFSRMIMEWKWLETLLFSWEWASDLYALSYLLIPWLAGVLFIVSGVFYLRALTNFDR